MKFDRYKFYQYVDEKGRQVVVAVSRHAGRTVKGYAKCDPDDEFDLEIGKRLAAARCNATVIAKKQKTAHERLMFASDVLDEAKDFYKFSQTKVQGLVDELAEAEAAINNILSDINSK